MKERMKDIDYTDDNLKVLMGLTDGRSGKEQVVGSGEDVMMRGLGDRDDMKFAKYLNSVKKLKGRDVKKETKKLRREQREDASSVNRIGEDFDKSEFPLVFPEKKKSKRKMKS